MYRVALRSKEKKNGMKSLYLQFNPPIKDVSGKLMRYEFLNLEIYQKPKNKIQKDFNSQIEEIAETIRCERYIKLVHNDFSFLAADSLDGDFIAYFRTNGDYHGMKYVSARKHFQLFCNDRCLFRDINAAFCIRYREHLLRCTHLSGTKALSHNSASSYFSVFLGMLHLAYKDNILQEDYTKDIEPIKWNHQTNKEYLSTGEIEKLKQTPYDKYPELRRASLFSIYTGLRRSDIIALRWENIIRRNGQAYINITISKTGNGIFLPLSDSAIEILGKEKNTGLVFQGLTTSIIDSHLKNWIQNTGIKKHITFHCFRHTFAMLLLERDVSIYTISRLLGHKQFSSTQVYARVTDKMTLEAVKRI